MIASLAVAGAVVAASANAAPLPQVSAPAPPVAAPSLPEVAPPPIPVPAPTLPAPPPVPVPVPATPPAPRIVDSPGQVLGNAVRGSVEQVAAAPADALAQGDAGGRPTTRAGGGTSRRRTAAQRREAARVYHRRRQKVRRLSGCLDQLSPRGSRLLVLRYGIGRARPHAAGEVARKLRLGPRRYATVHRRALHWLVRANARSGCGHAERSSTALSWSAIGSGTGAGVTYASDISEAGGGSRYRDGQVGVLGESAEGGTEPPSKSSVLGGHLPLADDSTDIPYLVAVGVLMLSLFAWVFAKRRRADAEEARATQN